jgi:hypothetical protein
VFGVNSQELTHALTAYSTVVGPNVDNLIYEIELDMDLVTLYILDTTELAKLATEPSCMHLF